MSDNPYLNIGNTKAPVEENPYLNIGKTKETNATIEQLRPSTTSIAPKKATEVVSDVPFAALISDDANFKKVQQYMKAATGQTFDPKKQTREDFAKDFMSLLRGRDVNSIQMANELRQQYGTDEQTKQALAQGRGLFEKVKPFYKDESQSKLAALKDYVVAGVTDPLNYVGGIAGIATRNAMKKVGTGVVADAAKSKATKEAVLKGAALEGGIGAATDALSQKRDIKAAELRGENREFSAAELALATALGGAGGALSGKAAVSGSNIKTTKQELADKIAEEARKAPPAATPQPMPSTLANQVVQEVDDHMSTVANEWKKMKGKEALDSLLPPTPSLDAKARVDLVKRTRDMVWEVIQNDPTFSLRPNERISDAFNNVFAKLDNIDDNVLKDALLKSGVTAEDFARMTQTTVREAAQTMNAYSQMAKKINRLASQDSNFKEQMNSWYGRGATGDDSIYDAASAVLKRIGNERKAILTSGIDTMNRNVIGSGIGLTFKTASGLLSAGINTVGVTAAKVLGADVSNVAPHIGFKQQISNALNDFYYMKNAGISNEVTNLVLDTHPSLKSNLLEGFEGTNRNEVSAVAKWASSLNQSVDAYQRKAVFTSSLDSQLSDLGYNLFTDFIAKDRVIPKEIVRQALDDAQKSTFSYLAKREGDAFQNGGGTVGRAFVDFAERFDPLGVLVTFPRFMANSMAFAYQYGGGGAITTAKKLADARNAWKSGDQEFALKLYRDASRSTAETVVGVSALAAAIDYRRNHQDTKWNEVQKGEGVVNIGNVFPTNIFMGVADLVAKSEVKDSKPDIKGITESIIGMKMPAGTTNTLIESMINLFKGDQKDERKLSQTAGKLVGEYLSGFSQPFVTKQVFDIVDMLRGDEAMKARNPNNIGVDKVIQGDDVFFSTMRQNAIKNIPILKEQLPETQRRFVEGESTFDPAKFIDRLTALKIEGNRSDAEKALVGIGIEPYLLYPPKTPIAAYDDMLTRNINKAMINSVDELTKSKLWQGLSQAGQREKLKKLANDVKTKVKDDTDALLLNTQKGAEILGFIAWDKLSSDKKSIINEEYARTHNGRTIDEDKAYEFVPGYQSITEKVTKQYASGGVVLQTVDAFSKGK